jgi:hypothetical protein
MRDRKMKPMTVANVVGLWCGAALLRWLFLFASATGALGRVNPRTVLLVLSCVSLGATVLAIGELQMRRPRPWPTIMLLPLATLIEMSLMAGVVASSAA